MIHSFVLLLSRLAIMCASQLLSNFVTNSANFGVYTLNDMLRVSSHFYSMMNLKSNQSSYYCMLLLKSNCVFYNHT